MRLLLFEALLSGIYFWVIYNYRQSHVRTRAMVFEQGCSKQVIQIYNWTQILLNSFFLFTSLGSLILLKESRDSLDLLDFWSPQSDLNIWLLNMNRMPGIEWILHTYHWSRYLDWFDTYILISKRKEVGWLHQIHHGTIPLVASVAIHWGATAPSCLYGVVIWNAFVHMIMYTYYYLVDNSSSERIRISLRTNKFAVTAIQMIQFTFVAMQSFFGIFYQKEETTPWEVFALQFIYMMLMLILFAGWLGKELILPRRQDLHRKKLC